MTSKIVLITGASSGIGAATARRLAADGHLVVVGARRVDRLEALVQELAEAGHEAEHTALDVTSADSVKAFVEGAFERHGRIDVLVNNAGIMPLSPLSALRVDEWNQMIDVNVKGLLHGVAAALPLMKAQGSGHIVNMTSALAHYVAPATAVYSATKYAMRAISDGLRKENDDIRVTEISPAFAETELLQGGDPGTMARVGSAADKFNLPPAVVADAIAYAIAQPAEVDVSEIVIRARNQLA
ncbi:SDR family oxidoreductase [Streptomyces sp. SID3212]|uniref:SDR family oxidoreductase n=1 Tax=Streptomyces sp. SID3212 TaxID=2690259 RepID=UPI001F26948D|nr:SDR family oxidoreductase [Streptomyces sp. SID3212]